MTGRMKRDKQRESRKKIGMNINKRATGEIKRNESITKERRREIAITRRREIGERHGERREGKRK